MLSGCKDNWSYTSYITWSVILSKSANLNLPIYCTFFVVREHYNVLLIFSEIQEYSQRDDDKEFNQVSF